MLPASGPDSHGPPVEIDGLCFAFCFAAASFLHFPCSQHQHMCRRCREAKPIKNPAAAAAVSQRTGKHFAEKAP